MSPPDLMRTPVSLLPILGLALAVCFPAHAQNEARPVTPTETKAASTTAQSPASTSAITPELTKPESSKPEKKALPPDMKLSAWTSEVVKLARAGIDESVMLSFIDNSGTFNLGADQIVYLSDLGVPSTVINNMLQHDREVIAGVRVLTISSDPGYEPIPGTVVAQSPSAPAKTEPTLTAPSPAPATVLAEKPSALVASSFPNVTQLPIEPQPSAPPLIKVEDSLAVQPVTFSPPRTVKKNPYPTRSPYAEELLPPIIVVKAYTPTPNVIIIERFPDAKP